MSASNLWTALAKAQAQMAKAKKDKTNPHFRSSYADLSSVQDACFPALNDNGISVVQFAGQDEDGHYLMTRLVHGESGDFVEGRVPLMMTKVDMQGYGSAMTYARRYGLMALAGIAPADDDGNAASAPVAKPKARRKKKEAEVTDDPKPLRDLCYKLSGQMAAFESINEFESFVRIYLKTSISELSATRLNNLASWLTEHKTLEKWPEAAKSALHEASAFTGSADAF